MSSNDSNTPSLIGQGPPDGSTVPTNRTNATAASDGITAHSPSMENQDHDPDIIELYAIAAWIGDDNDDYRLDLDLDYLKGRGGLWIVQLQQE